MNSLINKEIIENTDKIDYYYNLNHKTEAEMHEGSLDKWKSLHFTWYEFYLFKNVYEAIYINLV